MVLFLQPVKSPLQEIKKFLVSVLNFAQESVGIISWFDFKMMCLIVAKRTVQLYRSIWMFWSTLLLFVLLIVLMQSIFNTTIVSSSIFRIALPACLSLVDSPWFVLFFILMSRSSVPRKNMRYVYASKKTLIGVMCMWSASVIFFMERGRTLLLGFCLFTALLFPGTVLYSCGWLLGLLIVGQGRLTFYYSPIIVLWILWMLDAPSWRGYWIATKNTGKMFLLHWPFFIPLYACVWFVLHFLCVQALFNVFITLDSRYASLELQISQILSMLFLMPWYIAMMNYGYTKFMREHMGRYYELGQ